MSLTFIHMISLLLISISITVLTVSSRPITTNPPHHVVSPPSAKTLALTTSGGEKFEVQLDVALQSEKIRQMIVDGGFSDGMELSFPNITGETMSKVLEYCNKHAAGNNITAVDEIRAFVTPFVDQTVDEDLKSFDSEFVKVDQKTLFNLILAANDLKIKSLLDLTSQTVADMIKGKTPEEIRKMFHIKNDFTLEEEEEVRRENAWAFE